MGEFIPDFTALHVKRELLKKKFDLKVTGHKNMGSQFIAV